MADEDLTEAQRRRRAASTCAWCGGTIDVRPTGRLPKWCSPTCRQRAWEQTRAAASGRSAVEVIERRVEVAPPRAAAPAPTARRDWPAELQRLAHDLDSGAIYQRDLDATAAAVDAVIAAFRRAPSAEAQPLRLSKPMQRGRTQLQTTAGICDSSGMVDRYLRADRSRQLVDCSAE